MEFIRETTLVHLKIRCWSGEVKAQKTDKRLAKEAVFHRSNSWSWDGRKFFLHKLYNL